MDEPVHRWLVQPSHDPITATMFFLLPKVGEGQSFAKFFSKLGGVYDFPFREISREIRVVIWLFLPRNSSLGWEELGKSTVRDRNGQSPEKKMRFRPPGWPFSQEIEHFHQTIDKHD